ncbi:hypothetical protein Y032_0403g831 [Ancylostoma ceylanicum]|uniref:Uncharacterized protein n=1 Tax=Ancylostoma ceylanicum TaxID=53326 RepID=A0A016X352_9BILA|nr:hypothetical protein Y032_0403g831 [Ancylostoma ceylanicum]
MRSIATALVMQLTPLILNRTTNSGKSFLSICSSDRRSDPCLNISCFCFFKIVNTEEQRANEKWLFIGSKDCDLSDLAATRFAPPAHDLYVKVFIFTKEIVRRRTTDPCYSLGCYGRWFVPQLGT